jgi:hypothetical protein
MTERWEHPKLIYNPNPTDSAILAYKHVLIHLALSDTYIFISHCPYGDTHFGHYLIYHNQCIMHSRCARGIDSTQATCQAVQITLTKAFESQPGNHTFLWLQLKEHAECLLTLSPHRYTHISYDTRALIAQYLDDVTTFPLSIRTYHLIWPGAPTLKD